MTMPQNTKPPFRADHVGSLLRPAALKEARAQSAKGEIEAAALKDIEDREIERVIRKQEEVGLKSIPTANSAAPGGIPISSGALTASKVVMEQGVAFAGVTTRNRASRSPASSAIPAIR